MRTVRYDDVPEQPWKNGGGTTRELHRDERWRLSIATISAAASSSVEFSTFPGVDRTFTVARGTLVLTVSGVAHPLGPGDQLRFAGEEPVSAVPGGEVVAVNVMTTRPHRAEVRVASPGSWAGPAHVAVDLATLDTHFSPADITARSVVVEGIS